MRLTLFLLIAMVLPGAAMARTCEVPGHALNMLDQKLQFDATLECLIAEISDLKAEQVELKSELLRLQALIQALPGEFRNENGKVSRPDGGSVDRASFLLISRQGSGASSLPIDQSVLESLCSGNGGCTLSIYFEAEGLKIGETLDAAATGPCAMSYNRTSGSWAIGGGCVPETSGTGVDSNGAPLGEAGGEIAMSAGQACLFADADASRGLGTADEVLSADGSRGFFLIAAPALRSKPSGRFRCELKIE